jgi:hypothetical protein
MPPDELRATPHLTDDERETIADEVVNRRPAHPFRRLPALDWIGRRAAVLRCGPFVVLLTLVVWLTACGDDDSIPQAQLPVDSNLWNAAWEIANDSQRRALRDGELSFAEYESAALRTAECLDEAGVRGAARLEPSSQTYHLSARWQSTGDPARDDALRAATDRCSEEHWDGINQAWLAQDQPSEQE